MNSYTFPNSKNHSNSFNPANPANPTNPSNPSNLSYNEKIMLGASPELIKIRKTCDTTHKHCLEICGVANIPGNYKKVTQEYFNEFFMLFKNQTRTCCMSDYSNRRASSIKTFIIECSKFLQIPQWDALAMFMSDVDLSTVLANQIKLNPNFVEQMIGLNIISNDYGGRSNIINSMLLSPMKLKSFDCVIMSFDVGQFSRYLNIMTKQNNGSTKQFDEIIIKYISTNEEKFKLAANKEIGIKIINNFLTKPVIIRRVYKLISKLISQEQKVEIFNKSLSGIDKDKELILFMLDNRDIVPDINTINKLTERCYLRPEGCANSKQIADIIDMMCEYNLVITKQIVLKLLDHGCYVNNLEKHGIQVDGEILAKCANNSYYPYKFNIKPDTGILLKECSKHDNLNTIKKLKEFGGVYTCECLEEACKLNRNGKTIKYLLNECGVKTTDKCLEYFQEAYKLEALDVLMKNYKLNHPNQINLPEQKILNIDPESVMNVKSRDIKIDRDDDSIEYAVKAKIGKFFELKKKNIKYMELYQTVLKYLISNKLIIGNYFIISEKLSGLLKMNHCTLLHIDQLHNILTYFIDVD